MQTLHLTWIISIIVTWDHVNSQQCDPIRAHACTSELQSLYNETIDQEEKRTVESKTKICTLGIRAETDMMSTNITKCFQLSTVFCEDSDPRLQEVNARWKNVTDELQDFCKNDCDAYKNIALCKAEVNLTAVELGIPSEFCRSYEEGRVSCLESYFCDYKEMIFDALFDSSYFSNYYQNICLSGCRNLDETVQVLKDCYQFVKNSNPATTCSDHRKFKNCLQSKSPCREFPSLIPFLYRYDYPGNQRMCQDEACIEARTCLAAMQDHYDGGLVYHIDQPKETALLRDLCLIPLIDDGNKTCYTSNIEECSTSPRHPLRAQWAELIRDIHQLCDDGCDNVTSVVPECHSFIEYDVLENKTWSQFCSSHRLATECIAEKKCSLASAMFEHLISPPATQVIESVCTRGCSNLNSLLLRLESCSPHLDKEATNCGHYEQFKSCTNIAEFCPEADGIVDFLFPGFNALTARCNPTSSSPEVTSHKMTFFMSAVTSYLFSQLFP